MSNIPVFLKNTLLKKNVVLFVIDGIGFNYIKKNKELEFLNSSLIGYMHSVFPSSTAPGITSYLSGVPPIIHGIFGWNQWMNDHEILCKPLPFRSKSGDKKLTEKGLSIENCFNIPSFFENLKCHSYTYSPHFISEEPFNVYMTRGSRRIAYESFDDIIFNLGKNLNKDLDRSYHYVYYPFFDSLCHEYGISNSKTRDESRRIDKWLAKLSEKISGENATLIITSDHGMIDIPIEKQLTINSFPKLKSLLSRPISGEPRVIYCSVKKEYRDKFVYEFNQDLEKYAYLFKSGELVEQGWFGYSQPELLTSKVDAICDFIIIMKENYTLIDNSEGEVDSKFIGMHGGILEDEIIIPLAVIP